MDKKETINILQNEKSWESDNRKIRAFEEAISALKKLEQYEQEKMCLIPSDTYTNQCKELCELRDKQVPKKLLTFKPWLGRCPVCYMIVTNPLANYCDHCGNRLDLG